MLLALGYYPIYYLIFQKDFKTRYSKVKEKIDQEFEKGITDFLGDLKTQLKEKVSHSDLTDFVKLWSEKQSILLSIDNSLTGLTTYFNKILFSCAGVIILVALYFVSQKPPISDSQLTFLNFSAIPLVIEIYYVVTFFYNFHKLNTIILKIELGIPIEKVFEKEFKELLEEE